MTALFDERVETAIQLLWFDRNPSQREEALSMLRAAANLGDGDAYYFLGRCYLGKSYVDPVVGLPVDTSFAFECFRTSLTLESAIGMFGAMHQEGFEPPGGTIVHPPYHSKKRNLGCCIRICCAGAHFLQISDCKRVLLLYSRRVSGYHPFKHRRETVQTVSI